SPRGNLYASLILRPDRTPQQAAQFGFVAALAVGDALAALLPRSVGLAYKWPNDVLVNGLRIAGILLESGTTPSYGLAFVVVGMGVNLAASPRDAAFPATSVAEECDRTIAPAAMLEALSSRFEVWRGRWQAEGFAPVRAAWLARAAFRGERILVHLD